MQSYRMCTVLPPHSKSTDEIVPVWRVRLPLVIELSFSNIWKAERHIAHPHVGALKCCRQPFHPDSLFHKLLLLCFVHAVLSALLCNCTTYTDTSKRISFHSHWCTLLTILSDVCRTPWGNSMRSTWMRSWPHSISKTSNNILPA